jgi:hypothetical protein
MSLQAGSRTAAASLSSTSAVATNFNGPPGHMADAQSVPVIELPRRLRELDALKDRPVVLVCRMDRRSANAAALLTPPSTAAKAPAAGPARVGGGMLLTPADTCRPAPTGPARRRISIRVRLIFTAFA